jgi:NitT/TauT family transport system ATP-binding protein
MTAAPPDPPQPPEQEQDMAFTSAPARNAIRTLFRGSATPTGAGDGGAAVTLRGVTKRFGDGPVVLDDVTLDVAAGEFLCVLGASGCGKSTLLNLVAGLERPTAGQVHVEGDRAALMFQESALLPWLSATQNIELALRLRGVGKAERREEAQRLLALVRLEGSGDKAPHELSGGMRQRVALARALAQDSRVLLMDEPFGALDAITRDVLHDELTRIWHEVGVTVVFVTHNVREAVRLGQRVVLLSSRPGRVAHEYRVDVPQPRRIESPGVAALSIRITEDLSAEIRRHARPSGGAV